MIEQYQPYFCEENVWQALVHDVMKMPHQWAVFVSNASRTCALWHQKAQACPDDPVVWDYHVVAVGEDDEGNRWVLDADHTCGVLRSGIAWFDDTFMDQRLVYPMYRPMFRIVTRDIFMTHFSSDRHHMKHPDGQWMMPPPPWPRPGTGEGNLMQFVCMETPFLGDVMDGTAFRAWLS